MSNVAAGSFIPPLPVYLPPYAENGDDRDLEAALLLPPTALVAATRPLARPALDAASDEAEAAGADNETLDGGCPAQSHQTQRTPVAACAADNEPAGQRFSGAASDHAHRDGL